MSKVKYTEKEITDINNALDILNVITSDSSFEKLVMKIYGNGTDFKEVKKYMSKIDGIRKKINKNIREKDDDNINKKEIYFARKQDTTRTSINLYHLIEDVSDVRPKLRFDQDKYTCQIDIRIMLYAYIRDRDLRDDIGVKVDKNMRELAPTTFHDVDYIIRTDRTTIPGAIKEIASSY